MRLLGRLCNKLSWMVSFFVLCHSFPTTWNASLMAGAPAATLVCEVILGVGAKH